MPDTHVTLHDARTATERLLPTLTAAQIARISAHGYLRPITTGDILVDVGDKAVPFFVVVSGAIQILRPSGARDTLIVTHRPVGSDDARHRVVRQMHSTSAFIDPDRVDGGRSKGTLGLHCPDYFRGPLRGCKSEFLQLTGATRTRSVPLHRLSVTARPSRADPRSLRRVPRQRRELTHSRRERGGSPSSRTTGALHQRARRRGS